MTSLNANKMKTLTRAEEEVMRILWHLKKAFVKDILAEMKEPVPAYNTISTVIRILEKKGSRGLQTVWKYASILSFDIRGRIQKI